MITLTKDEIIFSYKNIWHHMFFHNQSIKTTQVLNIREKINSVMVIHFMDQGIRVEMRFQTNQEQIRVFKTYV